MKSILQQILIFFMVLILAGAAALFRFGPHDGQINLRTGALRYRTCWITTRLEHMSSEKEWVCFGLPDEWETVVT